MKAKIIKCLPAAGYVYFLLCIIIPLSLCNRIPARKACNIILISADTLRADSLNCYGFKRYVTSPNIDALAKDGILFEKLVAASPWTTPAHLSMLTSLHPSTHGVTSSFAEIMMSLSKKSCDFSKLPESRTTLSEVLKENGFATGAFTGGATVHPAIGFDQGFQVYKTSMNKLNNENMNEMYEWIEQNENNRFFLFWHHFEAHAPYLHGEFLADVLPKGNVEQIRKAHAELAAVPKSNFNRLAKQQEILRAHNCFNKTVCKALYLGGVLSTDFRLGQLMKFLRNKRLYDRTMIIFTSDHGEEFGEHSQNFFYSSHGHTLYDEMIHIPLIIKLPYSEFAGAQVPQVSRTVDIMPTILDFLSINPAINEMQGISLVPFWNEPASIPVQTAYTESLAFVGEKKSLRTDRYKFIISIDNKTVSQFGRRQIPQKLLDRELYDLHKDPKEMKNLLKSTRNTDIDKLAATFEQKIRKHVSEQSGEAEPIKLDRSVIEKLRGLGYVGN